MAHWGNENRQRDYLTTTKRECVTSKRQLQETQTRLGIFMEKKTCTVLCTYGLKRQYLRTVDVSTISWTKHSTDVRLPETWLFSQRLICVRRSLLYVLVILTNGTVFVRMCLSSHLLSQRTWISRDKGKKKKRHESPSHPQGSIIFLKTHWSYIKVELFIWWSSTQRRELI